jgi:hypothetical protein
MDLHLPNRSPLRRQPRIPGPLLSITRRLCSPLSPGSKRSPSCLLPGRRKPQSPRMGHPKSFKHRKGHLPSNHYPSHRHRLLLLMVFSGQMVPWGKDSLLCFRRPTPSSPLRGNSSGSRRTSQMPRLRGNRQVQTYSITSPACCRLSRRSYLHNGLPISSHRRILARYLCRDSPAGHCPSRS